MALTNVTGIGLGLAVWLAYSDYSITGGTDQEIPEGEMISATTLLKPIRQFILANRIPPDDRTTDIADLVASRMGQSIHAGIQLAWERHYRSSLKLLGYPDKVIEAVRINPKEQTKGTIPVYVERRAFRKLDDFVISGQLDLGIEGVINDTKSTSVFTYISGKKDNDYQKQLSVYRWLNQDIMTADYGKINFVFTDWQRFRALANPDYPQLKVQTIEIPLMSLEETEEYIRGRLSLLKKYRKTPEPDLPHCTDEELWRSEPVYKYYKDPAKAAEGGRATKNFDSDKAAAYKYLAEMGVGTVLEIPGKVKACAYCPAFDYCSQKDLYEHERA